MNIRLLTLLFAFAATTASARDIRITIAFPKGEKMVVQRAGKTMQQPELRTMSATIKPRRRAIIEQVIEFRFPKGFEFAAAPGQRGPKDVSASGGYEAASEKAAERFGPKNSGWSFTIEAKDGREFLTLNVRAEHTWIDFAPATYGEGVKASKRTNSAEDKVIAHATSTDFELRAFPGKAYRIPVRKGRKTIEVTITCAYAR